MSLGQCPICRESLDERAEPAAMPCGHLYCLACASFWFHSDGPDGAPRACTICRRAFRGADIVKLYIDSGERDVRHSPDREGAESPMLVELVEDADVLRGREVLHACEAALAHLQGGVDNAALSTALSQYARSTHAKFATA